MRRHIILGLLLSASGALAQSPVSYPPTDVANLKATVQAMQMQSSQADLRTLDASGNDTWTFPQPYASAPKVAYFPKNTDTTGKPIVCNWQTLTATSVTYHCDKSTGPIAALLQSAFNATGAAGTQVSVYARGTLATAP